MDNFLTADVERELHPESIDEWMVDILGRRGPLTLDCLNSLFPNEEARLLFAVDRLSRAGKIVIGPPQGGDYLPFRQARFELVRMQETSFSLLITIGGVLRCRAK
jgi:hypothetical protein